MLSTTTFTRPPALIADPSLRALSRPLEKGKRDARARTPKSQALGMAAGCRTGVEDSAARGVDAGERHPPERLLRPPQREPEARLGREQAGMLGERLPPVEPALEPVGLGQERREASLERLQPELVDERDRLLERHDCRSGVA